LSKSLQNSFLRDIKQSNVFQFHLASPELADLQNTPCHAVTGDHLHCRILVLEANKRN